MKYVDTKVTFSEVPDEISLCINISGCNIHCPDCHSKYLWEDIGNELTAETLKLLVDQNPGISCICILGGESCDVIPLISEYRHLDCSNLLKFAWYTGQDKISWKLLMLLDYYKTGPYIAEKGPLTSRTTNQKFYRVDHIYTPGEVVYGSDEFTGISVQSPCAIASDITSTFWKD